MDKTFTAQRLAVVVGSPREEEEEERGSGGRGKDWTGRTADYELAGLRGLIPDSQPAQFIYVTSPHCIFASCHPMAHFQVAPR